MPFYQCQAVVVVVVVVVGCYGGGKMLVFNLVLLVIQRYSAWSRYIIIFGGK